MDSHQVNQMNNQQNQHFDTTKSFVPNKLENSIADGIKKSVVPNKSANNFNPNRNDMIDYNFNSLGISSNVNTYQPNKLSNSIVHPPQKLPNNLLDKNFNQMQKIQNSMQLSNDFDKAIEFTYEYDFDENGVLYYLGTLGKSNTYKNPHDIGQIKVFASSLGRGRLADFVGREVVNLRSLNEPFSFFGVDLGEDRTLVPNSYSIWNRNSSSHVMLGWQLEASNDRVNFNVIDTRIFISSDPKINNDMEKERNLLKIPGCTSTWGIDHQLSINFPNGFRFFILKQIIKNSSGAYNMALSGFELYGKGLGKRWHFT